MTLETAKSSDWRSYVRIFLILLSIFTISLLLPGDRNRVGKVAVGDTWNHEDVIAKKDTKIKVDPNPEKYKSENRDKFNLLIRSEQVDPSDILNKLLDQNTQFSQRESDVATILTKLYSNKIINTNQTNAEYYKLDQGALQKISGSEFITEDKAYVSFKEQLQNIGIDISGQNNPVKPNWVLDPQYQKEKLESMASSQSSGERTIKKGEILLNKNEVITAAKKETVDQYLASEVSLRLLPGIGLFQYLGYLVLTGLIIAVLILYLRFNFPKLFNSISGTAFVLFWPVLFGFVIWVVKSTGTLSPYMIPFCIVPIVVKNFFSDELALFVHIVVVLIASYLTGLGYEFTFIQILAGIVTVLIFSETRKWDRFFISVGIVLATYAIGFLGINLIQAEQEVVSDLPIFAWLLVNGLLLLLAYPFIPLIEKLFGFTSSITLVELADMNNPLLKEMATKAPGTLQHSLQVGNLAEAATDAIGANSLLVRTAALYHDIGKIKQSKYFIENNSGNNLHAELNDNFESARIIIGHVTEGIKMAKSAKLPKEIIDFIETHHGDTRVEYFFRNQKNQDPDREFDESIFRYPGPKPKTKEQAILMLADSIEAACKSLKNPDQDELDNFVDKIVDHKIELDQFSDCNLSFKELKKVVEVIKRMLHSVYHVRVQYPEDKQASS